MSGELPIACSLGGAELAARVEQIRALGADGLVDVVEAPDRAVLRFRPEAGLHGRLETIIAAEAECCPFLDFELERRPDASILTIRAPNGGAEVVHELAGAFADRP
jgi:hypothetical protein